MNAQLALSPAAPVQDQAEFPTEEDLGIAPVQPEESGLQEMQEVARSGWQLQRLKPRHKDVCSLIAQGLTNKQVADICGFTPEYVGMLIRQPACVAFIQEMNSVVDQKLEMAWGKSVDAVIGALDSGNVSEKLKAVRLHGELTKRIGSREVSPPTSESSEARLARLANRLIDLAQGAQNAKGVIQGTFTPLPGDASV